MPQPTIATSGGVAVLKFGNASLPQGQGLLSWINLNDAVSWFWQDYQTDEDMIRIGSAMLPFLCRGVHTSYDNGPRKITLPMRFDENGGSKLGAGLATLSEAGEQYLTTDSLTAISCKLAGWRASKLVRKYSPYMWSGDLEFFAKDPYWYDIAATTPAGSPWSLAGSVAGSATNFTITYAGSARTQPTFTFTTPNNTAAITSLVLKNALGQNSNAETLTINFPGNLAANTAWTITIDCKAFKVSDQNGTLYDAVGTFPQVYGPVGQANSFTATVTTVGGASSGVQIAATYNNAWRR